MSIVPSPPQMGETDKWACAVCGHDEKEHWIVIGGIAAGGCRHLTEREVREGDSIISYVDRCTCDGFEDME